jgi:hypothetical protein
MTTIRRTQNDINAVQQDRSEPNRNTARPDTATPPTDEPKIAHNLHQSQLETVQNLSALTPRFSKTPQPQRAAAPRAQFKSP